jgi:ribose transport system ATP-binding protein
MTVAPLLHARHICKQFPGVKALDGVSLVLHEGEVLAVVGENGAGKSTLMKILAGVYTPDAGEILLKGEPVAIHHVNDAFRAGISLIHQELNLAENLSVTANLFLGRERTWGGPLGLFRDMRHEAEALLARVGLACAPDTPISRLSPGQRQLVEIARALSLDVRILIMDEPTSSLTHRETETLYRVIAELKKTGVAVVYISHRLGEVKRIADRVVVLRDGKNAGELSGSDAISHEAMVRLMVGRELSQFFQRQHSTAFGNVRLELDEVCYAGVAGRAGGLSHPVSLQIRSGEILGMAGLVGAGRTELAEAVFGLRPVLSGRLLLDGQAVRIHAPGEAINQGVLLVPEDRRYHGLVLSDSVRGNISLPNLDRLNVLSLVTPGKEKQFAEKACQQLRVRTPNIGQTVGLLSGGNQQKVVLAKWLARSPRVLIVDEPTRGIDVGAKSEIYALMDQLAGAGVAIWMISSDLEEILGMSDRVAVLHEGQLTGILERDELSEEAVMQLATGGNVRP